MSGIYENVRLPDSVGVLLRWHDERDDRHYVQNHFWSLRRFLIGSRLREAKVVNADHGDFYHVQRRMMMMGGNECLHDDDRAGGKNQRK
jgi:hypothetical protein